MPPKTFAPDFDKIPPRLRTRINSWGKSPPKWQHQAYGPLNAYLGLRFPPSNFLVKPQALLREELATPKNVSAEEGYDDNEGEQGDDEEQDDDEEERDNDDDEEQEQDDNEEEQDDNDDNDDKEEATGGGKEVMDEAEESDDSIDSRGVAVGQRRCYPDFCVEQYWGAGGVDGKHKPDVVRVIIELGSLRKGLIKGNSPPCTRDAVEIQLKSYMDFVGPDRWDGRLLLIGMLGKHVCVMRTGKDYLVDGVEPVFIGNKRWISMFDPKLVTELDDMYEYRMQRDPQ